jgi:hypothetical protein
MAEEKIISRIEDGSELGERVTQDITSLREELATIRQLLERGHSIDNALAEFRYLPSDLENPIRWGFIGVWGKGGANMAVSVYTTTEEDLFNHPNASDENVAAFAATFAHPHTIKVCKYLFRNPDHSREGIKKGCNLSDEELDAAVKPLLEGHFAEWEEGKLKKYCHDFVVTLIAMTRTALEHSWIVDSDPAAGLGL